MFWGRRCEALFCSLQQEGAEVKILLEKDDNDGILKGRDQLGDCMTVECDKNMEIRMF